MIIAVICLLVGWLNLALGNVFVALGCFASAVLWMSLARG